MRRWRSGPAVVLLALSAAACSGSTSADPPPAPSPTAAAASPGPSPAPSPSPSPTEVLPANDVDDPVAALEAIVAYRDWLFENPDPDKLALIYAERCSCYEEVYTALSDALGEGIRLRYDRPRKIEVLDVIERDGPFAHLKYHQDAPGAALLEADGSETDRSQGSASLVVGDAFLVREGGRWLVVALS